MIHTALSFLAHELNGYLKLRTGTPGIERVYLTSVATESNGIAIPPKSLGMSLINIEEERVCKEQKASYINKDGVVEYRNPEINLNLYILISANFQESADSDSSGDYVEGLKQLSFVISFFQAKNVFTPGNSPALSLYDPNIQKIVVLLYSYSFEQLYNFWSVVGARYLPSVLYKISLLTFQEETLFNTGLPVEKVHIDSKRA
jgi:hypothetical protein